MSEIITFLLNSLKALLRHARWQIILKRQLRLSVTLERFVMSDKDHKKQTVWFEKIANFPVKPEDLSQLIGMVYNGTITVRTAKNVFEDMLKSGKNANEVVSEKGLFQIRDKNEINMICRNILITTRKLLRIIRWVGESSPAIFLGQIMKETEGRLNLQTLNKVLRKRLLNE